MQKIPFRKTILSSFWGKRQELNRTQTIPAVYKQFCQTGRFDAFRFEWKEGDENEPHIFWDSDVAKWIESAAYSLELHPDTDLEAIVDSVVELIEKNQGEDGYFNIYFTVVQPENRFTNRMSHELYCAGHLIEAAVAYYDATGKDKFLNLMRKYADYIEKVFVHEDSAEFSTPGHEEIELALVKLWKCTGERRYLELSEYFIDTRGTSKKDEESPFYISHAYDQSHIPVREMTEAVGHSVRACYLYCAMADLALYKGDKRLYEACRAVFDDIVKKKMYITGGIGGSLIGEAFSEEYDLPNALAYSETCAAIGLALFAQRMSLIEADSVYADTAEAAIYNGVLAGCSLDGKKFFYENPLEINLRDRAMTLEHRCSKQHFPITERLEVFGCSCCPPNFTRFVASIADFLYAVDGDTVYVHHYMESRSAFGGMTFSQRGNYPWSGKVTIEANGVRGKLIAVRVPGWSKNYAIIADGRLIEKKPERGYVYIKINGDSAEIELEFNMAPQLIEANPQVYENAGRVALMRGPIVYCLEGVDNRLPLRALRVDDPKDAVVLADKNYGFCVVKAHGSRPRDFDGLYRRSDGASERVTLKFVPYYAYANRGETDMLVWVLK